jgi:hypothetical protein
MLPLKSAKDRRRPPCHGPVGTVHPSAHGGDSAAKCLAASQRGSSSTHGGNVHRAELLTRFIPPRTEGTLTRTSRSAGMGGSSLRARRERPWPENRISRPTRPSRCMSTSVQSLSVQSSSRLVRTRSVLVGPSPDPWTGSSLRARREHVGSARIPERFEGDAVCLRMQHPRARRHGVHPSTHGGNAWRELRGRARRLLRGEFLAMRISLRGSSLHAWKGDTMLRAVTMEGSSLRVWRDGAASSQRGSPTGSIGRSSVSNGGSSLPAWREHSGQGRITRSGFIPPRMEETSARGCRGGAAVRAGRHPCRSSGKRGPLRRRAGFIPPHTEGTEHPPPPRSSRVHPSAYGGSRPQAAPPSGGRVHPSAHGGNPCRVERRERGCGFTPPRTEGTSPWKVHPSAYGGNSPCQVCSRSGPGSSPRVRRGQAPPRAWGRRNGLLIFLGSFRFTPTRVGTT